MPIDRCAPLPVQRRHYFWATQPAPCGEYVECGEHCGIPGLVYVEHPNGRSISTDSLIRSLILNIINTKARDPLAKCIPPIAVGGHWSESYREDNLKSGTRIWSTAQYPVSRIQDATNLLKAQLQ